MCTAATYKTRSFYFGRTLDNPNGYGETVTVTPRNYTLRFRCAEPVHTHYAIIGMALVLKEYPLYFDAVNEKGLAMAGLNFPGYAAFHDAVDGKDNIAQFEFLPWILAQCASVREAKALLERINLVNIGFSESFPPAPLHWIIADKDEAITVESMADGLHIYPNPVGVLANNPPFPEQMRHLSSFQHLSSAPTENRFSPEISMETYSLGMGAYGLPGDLSSRSRFVRAAFVKLNSLSGDSEEESVSQFFHILGAVDQQRGCCRLGDGHFETTLYTSCCNVDKGIYYYTTYDCHQIHAVDLHHTDLNAQALLQFPVVCQEQIRFQN